MEKAPVTVPLFPDGITLYIAAIMWYNPATYRTGAFVNPDDFSSIVLFANIVLTKNLPNTITEKRTIHVPRYKVLLHNDDHNAMDHVVKALIRVFKLSPLECERIMLEAHRNGMALCTVEPLEQAELHKDQLASYSLISTIEPE